MELFERTASELSSMLRNKECSSVEITESVYNRIEKVEDKVNSYITLCRDTAIEKAKEVHKLVQRHLKNNRALMLVIACYFEMTPTLLDAAAISALGGFESKAGKLVGGGMFGFGRPKSYSITNLGKVENHNIKSMMFIPPASPAAKMTLGVVTLNGTMKVCSSRNEK